MSAPGPVVCVVGPTASGKSAVAELVAERLGGPVVSVDAMQVYRGMDVGTAKTPAAATAAIPVKRIAKPPLFVRAAGTRAACCGALSAAVSPALARRSPSNRIVSAHSLDGNRPHREGTVARYFMGTVEKPEGDTFMGLPHLLSFSLRK